MPRKAPRVQTPKTSAGQAYGVAGEQEAALNAIPIPTNGPQDLTTGGVPGAAVPAGASAPPPPGGALPPDPNQLADQTHGLPPGATEGALGTQMPNIDLFGPSARPNEPVTHGLSVGPGGGPEVLSTLQPATAPPSPVGATLAKLAAAAGGNQALLQLAQEAQIRGV